MEQLLPPLRRPRPAGQAQRHQICLGDGLAFGGGLPRLVQEGGPRTAQRRLQHLGAHTLHPQLALLATPALAALLAVHVGHIGVLHLLGRDAPLQVAADDKARSARVG